MREKLEFRMKLSGISELAHSQEDKITLEEVDKYFEEDGLTEEQLNLVCDYLLSQKIAVYGYTRKTGTIHADSPKECVLSAQEEEYLEEYLRDLGAAPMEDEKLRQYLVSVAELARKLNHPEIFLGDMIQEGNVSLMLAMGNRPEGAEEEQFVLNAAKAGIQALIESQAKMKRQDQKIVRQAAHLNERMEQLAKEMGRKVTIEEVAAYVGMPEEEVEDILKLTGDEEENL